MRSRIWKNVYFSLPILTVVAISVYLLTQAGSRDDSIKLRVKRGAADESLLQHDDATVLENTRTAARSQLRDVGRKIEKRSALLQCQASMCPRNSNGPGGGPGGTSGRSGPGSGPGTGGGGSMQHQSCPSLGGVKVSFDNSTCVDVVESSVTTFDNSAGNFTDDGTGITECSQEDLEKSAILYVNRRGCERTNDIPLYLKYLACNGSPSQGTVGAGDSPEDVGSPTMKRSVFPPDERELVINPKETFPWSAIARISNGCTGTFIGPRHVLTAGHCVYNYTSQSWYNHLDVWRAKDCDPDCGKFHKWTLAITVKGWAMDGLPAYDYALIVVDRPSPVIMLIGYWKPIPMGVHVNIAGYPTDLSGSCMWRDFCPVTVRANFQLGHSCDTFGGMSGSPIYSFWPAEQNRRIIHCVHAYGGAVHNICTRITHFRFTQIIKWIATF